MGAAGKPLSQLQPNVLSSDHSSPGRFTYSPLSSTSQGFGGEDYLSVTKDVSRHDTQVLVVSFGTLQNMHTLQSWKGSEGDQLMELLWFSERRMKRDGLGTDVGPAKRAHRRHQISVDEQVGSAQD
ncbi:hypothetical protein Q8A73_000867 [Channa argus]|nr:hypothetical protein Q8A73_000867 [Channa argus]